MSTGSYLVNSVNSSPLVGTIVAYGGTSIPASSGWLLCDGSTVSRTTYASLFSVVSTSYGAGDGSTTFKLPDLRTKFLRGNQVTSTNSGSAGTDTVTLVTENLPSHSHTYQDAGFSTDGGVGNNVNGAGSTVDSNNGLWFRKKDGTLIASKTDANTFLDSGSTGSGTSFSILPSYVSVNYIIKY